MILYMIYTSSWHFNQSISSQYNRYRTDIFDFILQSYKQPQIIYRMEQGSKGFDALNYTDDLEISRFSQSFGQQNKNGGLQEFSYPSEEIINSIKQQLYQANQILPAHKTISSSKQKVSFKLNCPVFYKQSFTERPNRSSFPSITPNSNEVSQQPKGNQSIFKLKQEMGEFSVFLNEKKILIYQRIKNQPINYLYRSEKAKSSFSKNQIKYFCSLFLNPKLKKNKSLNQPIWEHVDDSYDLTAPKVSPDVLQFQSCFQSGNLFAVFKDTSNLLSTYELYLQNDVNTKGSTQWFYFKVISKARIKVKFKVMNFYKSTSLYEEGMKILVKSQGQQWKRVGTAIKYGRNPIQDTKGSYFLQFLYEFESSIKPVYFSYCYPYNYTKDLCFFIEELEDKNYKKKIFKKQLLCKTNMGNQLFMLSISNNIFLSLKTSCKPIIYIIGRQHSGETPSSFVLKGIINFLLSSRLQAKQLRENFQFRIIPMVNIDGVISGNYRTNISGNDVNRQWLFPSKILHPQIYHIKQEILSNKRNVQFFLDIHAHSRKMNSFFYGCSDDSEQSKLYPFVCSKLNKFISYADSSFNDDPSKSTTARVVMQKELNIVNSLTFEISFYGWIDNVKKTKHHFNTANLEEIGISLGLGFYYSQISLKKLKGEKWEAQTQLKANKSAQKQRIIFKNTLKISEKWNIQLEKQLRTENDQLSQGSQIDPDQFTLQKEEIQSIQLQNQKLVGQLSSKKGTKIHQVKFSQISNHRTNLKQDPIQTSRRYEKVLNDFAHRKTKNLSDFCLNIEEQEEEKNMKSNLFSYSINGPLPSSFKKFTLKKLEKELVGKRSNFSSISESRYLQKSQKGRKGTIDFKQTFRYHDKIREIKSNFSYCLKQSQKGLIDLYDNANIHKRFVPQIDRESQVKRNFSQNQKGKKEEFISSNGKICLNFNEKRGNSFFKSRRQSDFKLQKV